jgi:nucleoside 2-deoxyribosyltransferase-like protein
MRGGSFYVASTLSNYKNAHTLITTLEQYSDNRCLFDWTKLYKEHLASHKLSEVDTYLRASSLAQTEVDAVSHADFVVVLLPGGTGTHVELGVALALGKPVFLIGWEGHKYDSRGIDIFYCHPGVTDLTQVVNLDIGNEIYNFKPYKLGSLLKAIEEL